MLSDKSIIQLCVQGDMIAPYHSESVSKTREGHPITSSGVSSYGYDLSMGPCIRRMKTAAELAEEGYSLHGAHGKLLVIDPSNFNPLLYHDLEYANEYNAFVIYPNEKFLAVSGERVQMPRDVSAICMQKSTIARTFLHVEVTPLEAGWEGFVTYEISNPTDHPAVLYVGQGVTQALFFKGDQQCATTYEDRGGKYQDQPQEPIIPRSKSPQRRGYPYLARVDGKLKLQFEKLSPDERSLAACLNIVQSTQITRGVPGLKTGEPASKASLHRSHDYALTGGLPPVSQATYAAAQAEYDQIATATPSTPSENSMKPTHTTGYVKTVIHDEGNGNFSGMSYAPNPRQEQETIDNATRAVKARLLSGEVTFIDPQLAEKAVAAVARAMERELSHFEHLARERAAEKKKHEHRLANARTDVSVHDALNVIAKAIHDDPGYAWSWICNLAGIGHSAGGKPAKSNSAAADFLFRLFGYRAWTDNETFISHQKRDDEQRFYTTDVSTQAPADAVEEGALRHALSEEAVREMISEARSKGVTYGAKPGSTAARLGILPTHPIPVSVSLQQGEAQALIPELFARLSGEVGSTKKLAKISAKFFEERLDSKNFPGNVQVMRAAIATHSGGLDPRAADIMLAGLNRFGASLLNDQSA